MKEDMRSPLTHSLEAQAKKEPTFMPETIGNLKPMEFLNAEAEPSDNEMASYVEVWRKDPPSAEFANLPNAAADD